MTQKEKAKDNLRKLFRIIDEKENRPHWNHVKIGKWLGYDMPKLQGWQYRTGNTFYVLRNNPQLRPESNKKENELPPCLIPMKRCYNYRNCAHGYNLTCFIAKQEKERERGV